MRGWSLVFAGVAAMAAVGVDTDGRQLLFPQVARYGGIVRTPDSAEPPRAGSKIVFDITADSKPEELNKGLESVARYLNLNADVGLKATDVKLALVLHGPATRAALNDSAYARHTTAKSNPNLDLIRELKACGVEVFVCGQSLARNQFAREEVAGDVAVAVSAMTVNVNKQQEGYSYLSIH